MDIELYKPVQPRDIRLVPRPQISCQIQLRLLGAHRFEMTHKSFDKSLADKKPDAAEIYIAVWKDPLMVSIR